MSKENYKHLEETAKMLPQVVANAVATLKYNEYSSKFESVREVFGELELISSFSHNTPNLPSDELWGNVVLMNVANVLDYQHQNIANIVYDHSIPKSDKPPGHKLQLPCENIQVMKSSVVPYAYQDELLPAKLDVFERYGKGWSTMRLKKALDAFNSSSGEGNASERIMKARRAIVVDVLGMKSLVPEMTFSSMKEQVADSLESLAESGHSFYDIELKRTKKVWSPGKSDKPCFVRHVHPEKGVQHMYLEDRMFSTANGVAYEVHKDEVFSAMKKGEVIPAVPTILTALTVAPQIPHLGGAYFKKYAPELVKDIAESLGLNSCGLVLTTEGYEPFLKTAKNNGNKRSVFTYFMDFRSRQIRNGVGYGE